MWLGVGLALVAVGHPSGASSTASAMVAPPAVGDLLVARRALPDPNFRDSVVLLVAYGHEEGAAGVIVNRPADRTVGEMVADSSPLAGRDDVLYFGGPVAPSVMVVLLRDRRSPAGEATPVLPDVLLLDGSEALEAVVSGGVPATEVRFYAGYAGWAPGQLEAEIARGDWYLVRGDASWVFAPHPDATWESLTRFLLGPRA